MTVNKLYLYSGILLICFVCFSTSTAEDDSFSALLFQNTASGVRPFAEDAVLATSRWLRPTNSTDRHSTNELISRFDKVEMLWIYPSDSVEVGWVEFINDIFNKSNAAGIQIALPVILFRQEATRNKYIACRKRAAGATSARELLTVPFLSAYEGVYPDHNSNEFFDVLLEAATRHIDLVVSNGGRKVALQIDNAAFNSGPSTRYGGCLGPASLAGFEEYIAQRASVDEQFSKRLNEHLDSLKLPLHDSTSVKSFRFDVYRYMLDQSPMAKEHDEDIYWVERLFYDYQRRTAREFLIGFREALTTYIAENYLAENIYLTITGNLYAVEDPSLFFDVFDASLSEIVRPTLKSILDYYEEFPPDLIPSYLVFLPHAQLIENIWVLSESDKIKNELAVAAITVLGGRAVYPWDVYMGSNGKGSSLPRFYGVAEDWHIFDSVLSRRNSLSQGGPSCVGSTIPTSDIQENCGVTRKYADEADTNFKYEDLVAVHLHADKLCANVHVVDFSNIEHFPKMSLSVSLSEIGLNVPDERTVTIPVKDEQWSIYEFCV